MQKLACVLLVDDDSTTNYLNQLLLKRLNVAEQILVAINGKEALDLLHVHCQTPFADCPVLILLDVKMPVMDGFAFLEAYEQLPAAQRQATTIVMLTTSLHPRDVERVEHLNIGGFFNKPLNREKVDEILKKHFGRQLPAE
ncbi:response regulator [Hymenobacter negativus]|uniref:Response regulator n=1 Tax=Hymenobacter negativus TaxID=2795026 RepID=A0ABS0Q621_9BACT|nr:MULTISPECIES: response regulator [Bacteria]MBH8558103.1 response regulator [Hymenobacter negativus]MBH8568594.1 response regulator [Hymenobacter negativus]MBR7208328.1 response regulator [Microvirga sp. STS02]